MQNTIILEMKQQYPFGGLGQAPKQTETTSVRKTLHFQSQQQREMINHMIHFIRLANHPHLINLSHVGQEPSSLHLYYEYAPLRLERWLLAVNEELLVDLQHQLLSLAEYLSRLSIRFHFDPAAVGLSHELEVKYFLTEFCIDLENQEENLVQVKQQIEEYFRNLKSEPGAGKGESIEKRSSSISTNGSISSMQELQANITSSNAQQPSIQALGRADKHPKSAHLNEMVENSKKKCLEVLSRFKRKAAK